LARVKPQMSEFFHHVRVKCECRWAKGHMSDYLDGELPVGRRRRMERHVEVCPKCGGLLGTLRRMVSALHRLSPSVGGADGAQIAASVRRRLGEPPPR
jgi:anti-sigma factor RsiW